MAVAVVLKQFGINKQPTFDIALAAYLKYGESFLYALFSEISTYSNWFGRNRKDPKPAKQETQKKKRDWDKFRKEANGWVNLAGNLASAGVGIFNTIKNENNAQTQFSYSDDESGFNMTTRSGSEGKSFLEKKMLFIGLVVVGLLFFMLNK